MIPLYDEKAPSLKPPYITLFLIFLNFVVFIFTFFNPYFEDIIDRFGSIPNHFLSGKWEAWLTIFTSMFLHGSIFHLLGNIWFLWLFGDNVEYNFGRFRFLVFYFLCGLIAGLSNIMLSSLFLKNIPVIGASGAISGIMGAYLLLYPKNKIKSLAVFFIYFFFINIPAYIYIILWFMGQLILVFSGSISMIAYWSHIGGFLGGILLAILFKRDVKRIDIDDRGREVVFLKGNSL